MIQAVDQISVIICAYTEDRFNDLIAAVESVQRQTCPPCEIIVVIDHNPGLLRQVQEHISDVFVIENTGVRGLSGARNSGITIAKSPFIAFLDDDAIAAPNWLQSLSMPFADSKVLGVGGAVIPRWLDKQPSWFPEEFLWVVGCTYRGMPQAASQIRNPIGANMAFRREVFDSVGGFRSEIGRIGKKPLGCEETELCIRAHQYWPQGVFLYQPQASVSHCVPTNRATWRYFGSRCYAEGLSKAVVAQYVGAKESLSSERSYAFTTLPLGIVRGGADMFLRYDITGFLRACTILAGFVMTTVGYIVGSTFSHTARLSGRTVQQR